MFHIKCEEGEMPMSNFRTLPLAGLAPLPSRELLKAKSGNVDRLDPLHHYFSFSSTPS